MKYSIEFSRILRHLTFLLVLFAPLSNAAAQPALSLSSSNPVALMDGQAVDYSLSITNAGPGPTEQTLVLYELIPPYTTFNGATSDGGSVAAESVSCVVGTTPPGALPSSQLQICTVRLPSGGLPAGGTTRLRMNVTPRVSTTSATVVNKVALDPTGRNSAMNPALCNSTGIPAGCAVTPALQVVPTAPLLYLSKTNPPQLASGKVATYGLLVTNRGSKATGATLTVYDQLPGNMAYSGAAVNSMGSIRALGAGCSQVGGTAAGGWNMSCSISLPAGGLPPGASVGFSLNGTPSAVTTGRSLDNVAAIDSAGGNAILTPRNRCIATDNPIGCAITDPLVVDGRPAVTLGMSLSAPASLVLGTPATYSALIQNTGGVFSGTNLVSYVQMPAGFQFSSVAPNANGSVTARAASCTAAGQLLTCTLTLPSGGMQNPNDTVGYSLTLTPQPAALNTSVSLKAAVDPTGANAAVPPATCTADGAPSAGCAVSSVMTVAATPPTQYPPALSLSKSNPAALVEGAPADYSLSITNAGPGPTEQTLVLYELIPPYTTFNGATSDGGSVAAESVSCVVGTTPPGALPSSQLQICTVRLPSGGLPAGGTTRLRMNVTPRVSTTSATVVNKVALDPTGRNSAMNPALCNSTGIPAGCAVTPALQVVPTAPLLYLSKTNPPQLASGKVATYGLLVTNRGSKATGATLTVYDQLPGNMAYSGAAVNSMGSIRALGAGCSQVGGTAAGGWNMSCSISLPAGGLPPGASVGFSLNGTPSAVTTGRSLDNVAAIDSAGGNAILTPRNRCIATDNPIGCAITDPLVVDGRPAVTLGMSLSAPASLVLGTPATYSALIQNTGGVFSGTNLVSYVQMPAGFQFSSVAPNANGSVTARAASCTAAGQLLTCTLTLPSGGMQNSNGTVGYSLTLTPQPAALNTSVSLKAAVDPTGANAAMTPSSCTANGSPAGCAVTVAQTVLSNVDLSLNSANPANLAVGLNSSYLLTVTNSGSVASGSTVVVYDQLPANVQFVSASVASLGTVTPTGVACNASGTVASGQLLTCTLSLPASGLPAGGGMAAFNLNVLPQVAASGSSSINKAIVDATGYNASKTPGSCVVTGNPAGCAVGASMTVGNGIALNLRKTNPGFLNPGATASYTLNLNNAGTGATGTSLVVYDQLPANVAYSSAAVSNLGSITPSAVSCTQAAGTVAAGQLMRCTLTLPSGGLTAGASTAFTINVLPNASSQGAQVSNSAAIDPTGNNAAQTPGSTCVATDNPAGCAVASPQVVGGGSFQIQLNRVGGGQGAANFIFASNAGGLVFNQSLTTTGSGSTVLAPAVTYVSTNNAPVNLSYTLPLGGWSVSAVSCLDSNAAVSGNPSQAVNAATLSPSVVVTGMQLSKGASILCSVTVALTDLSPMLSLSKANPPTLSVGQPASYGLSISNSGGLATGTSLVVYDQLPPDVQYSGAAPATGGKVVPTGVQCTSSGSVAAGQLLTCTVNLPAGGLAPNGGSANFSISVVPQLASVGVPLVNRAAIDPTGRSAVQFPSQCTANDAPTLGCAVTPELAPIQVGVSLSLQKTSPTSFKVGQSSNYVMKVTNAGVNTSGAKLMFLDQLPPNLVFNSISPAAGGSVLAESSSCTVSGDLNAGQLLNCSVQVPSGLPARSGSTAVLLNLTPLQAAAGLAVVNKASIDPTGANAAVPPATCTADGLPSAGCAVSSAVMVVANAPALSLSKSNPEMLMVGLAADYSLSITNAGP